MQYCVCVCLQVAYNIRIALVGHIQFPEVLSLNWIQSNFISSLMEKIMVIKTVREKVYKEVLTYNSFDGPVPSTTLTL